MAERNSLLNCRTGNGTAGSNPALSAEINIAYKWFLSIKNRFFAIPLKKGKGDTKVRDVA